MFDLILEDASVVTPSGVVHDGSVGILGEKIAAIGKKNSLGAAHHKINLQGQILFPGMFDPHCHLGSGDERSYEYMANSFKHDTKDCLVGGVTSIATTTVLSKDPLPENISRTVRAGNEYSWIDFRVTSVVLSEAHVEQIPAAIALGCKAFKFYCGYCMDQAERMGMSRDGVPPDLFYRACEQVAKTDNTSLLMIHAEEPHVRRLLAERLKGMGRDDLIAWAEHSPQWSEAVQVMLYGAIAQELNVPLYVVHISRAPTLDLIEYLRSRGHGKIIAETLAYFLATNAHERHEKGYGLYGKIQPPLRFAEDQARLWEGLRSGTLSAIGTDTIPYTSKYKAKAPFWDARPGLNIQTLDTLPLLLTKGYHTGNVSLPQLARALAQNPAEYFAVGQRKGKIAPGYDADLVVVDLQREFTLGRSRVRGGSDYSIWEGEKVKGLPTMTFLRGQLVAKDGEIVTERPGGRYLDPT